MKRKVLSLLLTTVMAGSLLAGCGSKAEVSDNTSAGNASNVEANNGEVEKVTMYLPTSGKTDDMAAVLDKVNAISREKIGVEVDIKTYEMGQWFQQYSLFLSGTEDVDILINYGGYLNAVSQGAAYDLTDLLPEYGKDIIDAEGEFLKGGQIDGVQYAIPIYASYAWNMGIIYRKDVVEELGLTDMVANVKTLEDWGEVLAKVKEAKPDMTPFVTNNGNQAANFNYGTWDTLGNVYGVLMNGGQTSEVVDLFETDEYAQLCGVMHNWYEAGYTNKDIQTQTDSFTALTKNDVAFSTLGQTDFNTPFYQSKTCQKDIDVVMLGDPVARTYNNVTFTVMSNSEHPEASVKFLNLWFSDPEVGTLINYGIEGVHYQLDGNGMGSYLEGQDSSSCTYHLEKAINNTNGIRWNGENPDYAKLLVESNTNSAKSVAIGFAFDTTNVTNEITQLDNVCSKYQIGLECGALDPVTELPKFIEELKAAGIETVIAEKQAQLDAYLGN